eukprot:SAG11_NODE_11659_length_746_cov_0.642968_1_plen_195_part_01
MPCQNDGLCVEGEPNEFTCTCTPGWQGDQCQHDIDECGSTPCQNHGLCTNEKTLDTYTCACPVGWSGYNCDKKQTKSKQKSNKNETVDGALPAIEQETPSARAEKKQTKSKQKANKKETVDGALPAIEQETPSARVENCKGMVTEGKWKGYSCETAWAGVRKEKGSAAAADKWCSKMCTLVPCREGRLTMTTVKT